MQYWFWLSHTTHWMVVKAFDSFIYIISSYIFAFVNSSLHRHSPLYYNNNIPCAIVISATTTRWFRGQSKHFKRRRKGSWFCNRTLPRNFVFGSVHVRLTSLCTVGFLLFSLRISLELDAVHRIFLLVLQIDCQLTDLVCFGFLRDAWEKFSNVAWLFCCYFFSIYK